MGKPQDRFEPRLVSVEEAARALSLSRTVAYRLIADGRLYAVKIDGRTLVATRELDDFVRRLMAEQHPEHQMFDTGSEALDIALAQIDEQFGLTGKKQLVRHRD